MKTIFLSALCAAAVTFANAQTPPPPAPPTPPPMATPVPSVAAATSPAVAPVTSPAVAPAPSSSVTARDLAAEIHDRIKGRTHRHGHARITIGDKHDGDDDVNIDGEVPDSVWMAVPIIGIIFSTIFGAPVLIVLIIMLISWSKHRSTQRTVRELVAKGQPVPPELFATPGGRALRPWYDLRRGIILLAVGTGVMFFFGAVAGWDAGVWAFGLIPAIIGAGYILTWRLANKQENLLKQ